MAKQNILKAIWRIDQRLPVVIAALLVVNVLLFLYLTQSLEKDVAELERRYIAQQSEVRKAEQGGRSAESPLVIYARGVKDLKSFRDAIPEKKKLTGLIGEIFNLAESSGLSINRVTYDPKPHEELKLLKYSLTFVVDGSYNQIKKFTHKIEQSKRLVSIDQMKLNRDKKDKDVRLSLKLTTYFRAETT